MSCQHETKHEEQGKSEEDLVSALKQVLPAAAIHHRRSARGVAFEPWNLAKRAAPIARIECRTAEDVRIALRAAQAWGIPISVAGGRHDPWSRNNRDGVLILDLRQMNSIANDEVRQTVTFGGGTTAGHLLSSLPKEHVAVTGANGCVGMVGLCLGGGYGMLNSRCGLVSDTMVSAKLVLADGNIVKASEQENRDLFWALRGGGSGFGVVTSMTLETFQISSVLSGTIMIPLAGAKRALLQIQACHDSEPDAINLLPLFEMSPAGSPALFVAFFWTGNHRTGEDQFDLFASIPDAQVIKREWVPYQETLDPPELWPWGRSWYTQTQTISRIDEHVAEILVNAADHLPAAHCSIFLQSLHGLPSRIPPEATAFPLRREHLVMAALASWDNEQEVDVERRQNWVNETSEALSVSALPGGYVNFLGPEQATRVREFYGAAADRIRAIKHHVDPTGVFDASTARF